MSVLKVFGGIVCLSLMVGTGALAEMKGSSAAKAVESTTQQGGENVTHKSIMALSIDKFKQQDKDKMKPVGGEPLRAEDLAQQTRKGGNSYFN